MNKLTNFALQTKFEKVKNLLPNFYQVNNLVNWNNLVDLFPEKEENRGAPEYEKVFIERLQKSGILNAMFPEVSKKLKISNDLIKWIETAKSPEDVVRCLQHFLKDDKKKLHCLNTQIKLISNRLEKRYVNNGKEKPLNKLLSSNNISGRKTKYKNVIRRIVKYGRKSEN